MYSVRIFKTIWNKEEDEVRRILEESEIGVKRSDELKPSEYFYDVILEFPPFLNLSVSSGNWDSGEIKRVRWNADEKRFYCYVQDEFPVHEIDTYLDEEFLNDSCRKHGWNSLE